MDGLNHRITKGADAIRSREMSAGQAGGYFSRGGLTTSKGKLESCSRCFGGAAFVASPVVNLKFPMTTMLNCIPNCYAYL